MHLVVLTIGTRRINYDINIVKIKHIYIVHCWLNKNYTQARYILKNNTSYRYMTSHFGMLRHQCYKNNRSHLFFGGYKFRKIY